MTITYEMVHDTRVIPMEIGRAFVEDSAVPRRARGRWEGSTLVVETTNSMKGAVRGSSEQLESSNASPRSGPIRSNGQSRSTIRRPGAAVDIRHEPHARRVAAAVRTPATREDGLRNILSAARAEDRMRACRAQPPPK